MAKKDYYEVLGLQKGASEQDIKAAYKKSVMKYHPDRFATKSEAERKSAEDTFKEINHAYDVLSDPQKKSNYDQFGSEDGMQGGFGGGGGFSGGFGGGGGFGDIFGDIFNEFMGGSRRSRANMPIDGDDIVMRLDLTFEEAVFGVEKEVKVYRTEACKECGGTGAADPSKVVTCNRCHGSGRVVKTQQTIFGVQQVSAVCPDCGGKGKTVTEKCRFCNGGYNKKERVIPVSVPAGADDGQTITYYNEGEAGKNGGHNGRLIIQLAVKSHPLFKRKGSDLYMTLPITIGEATLGAKVKVPTTKSPVSYSIPAGTQSGTMFKIKGYGVKYLKREVYGDLYVTVEIETPTKLTKRQEQLLQEFEDSLIDKQHEKKKNFVRKYLEN